MKHFPLVLRSLGQEMFLSFIFLFFLPSFSFFPPSLPPILSSFFLSSFFLLSFHFFLLKFFHIIYFENAFPSLSFSQILFTFLPTQLYVLFLFQIKNKKTNQPQKSPKTNKIRNQKAKVHNKFWVELAKYSWAWGPFWVVVDILSDTLKKLLHT